MESCRKLDPAGGSPNAAVKLYWELVWDFGVNLSAGLAYLRTWRRLGRLSILVCAFLISPAYAFSSSNEDAGKVENLIAQQRWQEVVTVLEPIAARTPNQNYYYGLALAQLGRNRDAKLAFTAGSRQQPGDKRFPIELAGIAFKEKKYSRAHSLLQRALLLDPADSYANDFLATVFFLEGNLEAALKYWNRVDKPHLENVTLQPQPRIKAALLDRAFAFAPAATLQLAELLTSEYRIEGLGIFPVYRFQLNALPSGNFDLAFRATERNGWGANKWDALLSTFRGVVYQTIYPEYFNLHASAINITSLLRWDAQKRRAMAVVSGPLWQNPKFRYAASFDLRNENWNVVTSFTGPASLLGALNLRREALDAQIFSFNSGRWGWSTGMELSQRDYRSVFPGTALTPEHLLSGFQLKQLANVQSTLWRVTEHRFTLSAIGSEQAARVWSAPSQSFLKLQGTAAAHWFPRAQSDDYELKEQVRGGKTFGQLPFDELFMLGLERDNELLMRAHIGTRDGRKGSAPLGQDYFLTNWEINKNVYDNGLFGIRLSPFLDAGKISDPVASLGSGKWLFDTGMQEKFRVLTVGLTFTYGKDVRSGRDAFYFTAQ